MNRQEIAYANRPRTLNDFATTYNQVRKQADNLTPQQALSKLKASALLLPHDQRGNTPQILHDSTMVETAAFLERNPDTYDMLMRPEFQKFLSADFKKISTIESVWNSLPFGALWQGGKRGWGNVDFGLEASVNMGDFDNPEVASHLKSLENERRRQSNYLDELDLETGWFLDGTRSFFTNFGDTFGGLLRSAFTPEFAVAAGTGAAIGSAAGGLGAIPGAIKTGITGLSIAQGRASAGNTAWEIHQAQPDDLKDETIATTIGVTVGLASIFLEKFGLGRMVYGRNANKFIGQMVQKVTPKRAAVITEKAISKAGQITSLPRRVVSHTAPEVITEGLQSTIEMGGQALAANDYNNRYQGQGHVVGPNLEEILNAGLQGAWQAFWGGSGLGMISAVAEHSAEKQLQEFQKQAEAFSKLPPEEQAQIAENAVDYAEKKLKMETITKGNKTLKAQVGTITQHLRETPELSQAPEAMAELLTGMGSKEAHVSPKVLHSYFQAENERTGLPEEQMVKELLEPLGVSVDDYYSALDNGTDLLVNLAGMPHVINNPLWDKVAPELTVESEAVTAELEADLKAGVPWPETANLVEIKEETKARVAERLRAAGRTKTQAKIEAETLTRLLAKRAQITGESVESLTDKVIFAKASEVDGGDENSLYQPMVKAQDASLPDFAHRIATSKVEKQKTFFEMKPSQGVLAGQSVQYPADSIRHRDKKHKDMTSEDMAQLPKILDILTEANIGIPKKDKARYRGKGLLVKVEFEGQDYGLILESVTPSRILVTTFFKDTKAGVDTWFTDKTDKKRAFTTPAALWPAQVPPEAKLDGNAFRDKPFSNNIAKSTENDKTKYQDEHNPRGRIDALENGDFRIVFYDKADAATAIHEFQHLYLDMMLEIAKLPPEQIVDQQAHRQMVNDLATLKTFADVKDGDLKDGKWPTEAHEKVARAFEAYLMEGKAPTENLKGLFGRMKKWLLDIYKTVRALDVELSDDVRRVFDNQLLTEREVIFGQWQTEPSFDIAEFKDSITPEEWQDYERSRNAAIDAAIQEIKTRRNKEHQAMIRQWKKEGTLEAKESGDFKIIEEIVSRGGINRDSLIAGGYDQVAINNLNKRRPGLVRKDGKLGFDEFAQELGFDVGDDLIVALSNAKTLPQLVDDYVAQMEEFHHDYFETQQISDEQLDFWELELKLWAKQEGGDPPHSWRDIKRFIEKNIGPRPMDDNMENLRASLKAQDKAAKKAYKTGEKVGAMAKRLEMATLYKIKTEQFKQRTQTEAIWKRLASQKLTSKRDAKGIRPDVQQHIINLLNKAGFTAKKTVPEKDFQSFLNDLEANGQVLGVADWIRQGAWPTWDKGPNVGKPKTFRSFSYNEFVDLKMAIDNLAFIGKRSQEINVDGLLRDEDEVATELEAHIEAHNEIKPAKTHADILTEQGDESGVKKVWEILKGYMPSLIKIETVTRRLDGFEINGLTQKLVFKPINDAYNRADAFTEEMEKALTENAQKTVGQKRINQWRGEKVIIDGLVSPITREQLICIALNAGNHQNRTAVMNLELAAGNKKLTPQHLRNILDHLTKEEWDFVQGIWDFLDNQTFPQLNELTLRTTGVPLVKVEAMPVKTKFGTYRGGYYPLKFDTKMSERADRQSKIEMGEEKGRFENLYSTKQTKARATIARVGTTYKNLAPELRLSVLSNSLKQNIHDLSHREAVSDVWRLIKNPKVKSKIIGAVGETYWQQMVHWLSEVTTPDVVGDGGARWFLRKARGNLSLAAMGFKVSTVLCQVSGITQSMEKLGAKWATAGFAEYLRNVTQFRETTNMIYEKSPELARRNSTSYDRDVHDMFSIRNPMAKTFGEKFQEAAFVPMRWADQLMANGIWLGGYLKAIKELNMAEGDAVAYANTMLRITQPSGSSHNLSRAQRGWGYGDAGKLLTMFQTFFSGTQNLIWEQFHKTAADYKKGDYVKGTVDAGRSALYLVVLPSVLDNLVKNGEPEDEEELIDMAKGVVSFSAAGMPGFRDIVSFYTGDSYQFRPVPVLGAIGTAASSFTKTFTSAYEGEFMDSFKHATRVAGPLTGIPSSQISATIKGIEDWDENEGLNALYRLLVRDSK